MLVNDVESACTTDRVRTKRTKLKGNFWLQIEALWAGEVTESLLLDMTHYLRLKEPKWPPGYFPPVLSNESEKDCTVRSISSPWTSIPTLIC